MKLINENSYVLLLKSLDGNEFQDEVIRLMAKNHLDFCPITTLPSGDGGADGLYHKRTHLICCYGLKQKEIYKTKAEYRKAVVTKFTSDMMRVLEIEQDGGRGNSKRYRHVENDQLYGILSDGVKISHIRLVCNWNEDNRLIGEFNNLLKKLLPHSQKRFFTVDCDCVFLGPKELVLLCPPGNEALTRLRFPDVYKAILNLDTTPIEQEIVRIEGERSLLDSKFDDLRTRFGNTASKLQKIDNMYKDVEKKWIKEIVFKETVSPEVFELLHKIKTETTAELEAVAYLEMSPNEIIKDCKEKLRLKITTSFEVWDAQTVDKVVEMISAYLIGECPLDWRDVG